MKILVTPDSQLLSPAQQVKLFSKKLRDSIEEMKKTLLATRDPVGVGLAAPQVGILLRIFIARGGGEKEIRTFINPKIISVSQELSTIVRQSKKIRKKKPKETANKLLEGCLSIPNIWGHVARKKSLTLSYQDLEGKKHSENFQGFLSVIIQHEIDHLNGILFTKHVLDQGEKLYRSYKNEKGEDEFEEIKL